MNILMYLVVILGVIIGSVPRLAIVIMLFGTIGFKIYKKIKYGNSLYDQEETDMVQNIFVGLMAVIAIGAGILGLWLEKAGTKENTSDQDKITQNKNKEED